MSWKSPSASISTCPELCKSHHSCQLFSAMSWKSPSASISTRNSLGATVQDKHGHTNYMWGVMANISINLDVLWSGHTSFQMGHCAWQEAKTMSVKLWELPCCHVRQFSSTEMKNLAKCWKFSSTLLDPPYTRSNTTKQPSNALSWQWDRQNVFTFHVCLPFKEVTCLYTLSLDSSTLIKPTV